VPIAGGSMPASRRDTRATVWRAGRRRDIFIRACALAHGLRNREIIIGLLRRATAPRCSCRSRSRALLRLNLSDRFSKNTRSSDVDDEINCWLPCAAEFIPSFPVGEFVFLLAHAANGERGRE